MSGSSNLPGGVTHQMIDAQVEAECVICELPTDRTCDRCDLALCDRETCEAEHLDADEHDEADE